MESNGGGSASPLERDCGLWDRRDVIVASAGAAMAAAGFGAARLAMAAPAKAARVHVIVADRRFAESRAFAAEAARSGQRIAWIDGDVTDLWYDELDGLWRRKRAAIAGLTAYGAFFCLERLAMDRGLRVAFKQELPASLYNWVIAPKGAGA